MSENWTMEDLIEVKNEWKTLAKEQTEKVKKYEKTLLKIKELYESGDENKLDEYLHGLFTNEVYNDSY